MLRIPAIGVAVLVSLALVACGGTSENAAGPPPPAAGGGAPTDGREQAPAVAGESLSGEPIELGDFRGRPVLVNVWSSW